MSSGIMKVEASLEESVPENAEYLKELEDLAKFRYTEEDSDYVAARDKKDPKPPVQPGFSNDRGRPHSGTYRDRDRRSHDSYNGYQRPEWNRDRERNWNRDNSYKRKYWDRD
ncbi:UNVERIFIED_CONTAM: hypothetical protein RMT77_000124 [Armadillidium vulgare]|nr:hypothetical protein Avbf_07123 [Armadillidium vulgare]